MRNERFFSLSQIERKTCNVEEVFRLNHWD